MSAAPAPRPVTLAALSSSSSSSSSAAAAAAADAPFSEREANEQRFAQICRRLDKLLALKDDGAAGGRASKRKVGSKALARERYIFRGTQGLRERHESLYPIMRLFMPHADTERKNYLLKEAKLAECFASWALQLPESSPDALKLKNFKNPQHTRIGGRFSSAHTGDFAAVLGEVLASRSTLFGDRRPPPGPDGHGGQHPGGWTVGQANEWLDELQRSGGRMARVRRSEGSRVDTEARRELFARLADECNASEMTWIARIILGDLKIGIKQDVILRMYHPDAPEAFASSGDLRSVFEDRILIDPTIRHKFGIKVSQPFTPVTACKFVVRGDEASMQGWKIWDEFFIEKKLDGERQIVHKFGGQYRIYSRKQVDHTGVYLAALKKHLDVAIAAEECILDGEMMTFDTETQGWVAFGHNITTGIAQTANGCASAAQVAAGYSRAAGARAGSTSAAAERRAEAAGTVADAEMAGRVAETAEVEAARPMNRMACSTNTGTATERRRPRSCCT